MYALKAQTVSTDIDNILIWHACTFCSICFLNLVTKVDIFWYLKVCVWREFNVTKINIFFDYKRKTGNYNAINIDICFCRKDVHVYIICGIVVKTYWKSICFLNFVTKASIFWYIKVYAWREFNVTKINIFCDY